MRDQRGLIFDERAKARLQRNDGQRTAQRMADQQINGMALRLQMLRGQHQILDVGREMRVGKLPAGVPKPGEIEAQYGKATISQGAAQDPRRTQVLGAGEAVGEQRARACLHAVRCIEDRSQRHAFIVGELHSFRSHRVSLYPVSVLHPEPVEGYSQFLNQILRQAQHEAIMLDVYFILSAKQSKGDQLTIS